MAKQSVLLKISPPDYLRFTTTELEVKAALECVAHFVMQSRLQARQSMEQLNDTTFLFHLEQGLPYFARLTSILIEQNLDYEVAYLSDFNWVKYPAEEVTRAGVKFPADKL